MSVILGCYIFNLLNVTSQVSSLVGMVQVINNCIVSKGNALTITGVLVFCLSSNAHFFCGECYYYTLFQPTD